MTHLELQRSFHLLLLVQRRLLELPSNVICVIVPPQDVESADLGSSFCTLTAVLMMPSSEHCDH